MDRYEKLTHFIERIVLDTRLKPVHISLFIALCHGWIASKFQRSYRITRRLLMNASRIRSRATYHKTMKELQSFGYLKYNPSYHPFKASEVEILDDGLNATHDEP
jgi:hypothetical protein